VTETNAILIVAIEKMEPNARKKAAINKMKISFILKS